MTSPSSARAQAFQLQRERLDARTKGVKQCTPPNRRCGDRCIPPDWDCRLKGEGNDPHLRANGKGTDIISGLANVERGGQKLVRSVKNLSFSELESSRRSFGRGAAKLHPGDLKQKEDAKKNAINVATWVGIPLVAAIGAGLLHKGLSVNKAYRDNIGERINRGFEETVFNMKRNAPFVGRNTRAREAAGTRAFQYVSSLRRAQAEGSVESVMSRQRPEGQFFQSGVRRINPDLGVTVTSGRDAVNRSLMSVDLRPGSNKPSMMKFTEWEQRSMRAFWSTKLPGPLRGRLTGDSQTNLFAVGTTNQFMRRTYGIQPAADVGRNLKLDAENLVRDASLRLKEVRKAWVAEMKERGLDYRNSADVDRYLDLKKAMWTTNDEIIDDIARREYKNLLANTETTKFVRDQYIRTREAFSTYFEDQAREFASPPSIVDRRFRNRDARNTSAYLDGLRGYTTGLANLTDLNWPSNVDVTTPYMGELVRRAYHAKFVMGGERPLVSISSRTTLINLAKQILPDVADGRVSDSRAVEIVSWFLQERVGGFAGVTFASGRKPRGRKDSYAEAFRITQQRLNMQSRKSLVAA